MSRQPTFTERERLRMDADAVQEAEKNLSNVNTGLGQRLGDAASGIAQTASLQSAFDDAGIQSSAAAYKGREWRGFEVADKRMMDNKAKAELESLQKGGVEKLQTYFDSAGIAVPASVFRKDVMKGYEFYEKKMEQTKKNDLQKAEASILSKILAHSGKKTTPIYGIQDEDMEDLAALDEMDKSTGGEGFDVLGMKAGQLELQTGEKEEDMSNMEIVREVLSKEGMPPGMDSKKFGDFLKTISKLRGVQDDSGFDSMTKDEADEMKAVLGAKEAKAKWDNISNGDLPVITSKSDKFEKKIESIALDADKLEAQNSGLKSMIEFFNQGPENFETGAYDTALVFEFMRALDPQSVVREGEFDTAAKSAGAIEFALNFVEKMKSGKFLGKKQRIEFMKIMKNVVDYRRKSVNERVDALENRAPQLYYNKTDEATKQKVRRVIENTLPDMKKVGALKVKKKSGGGGAGDKPLIG